MISNTKLWAMTALNPLYNVLFKETHLHFALRKTEDKYLYPVAYAQKALLNVFAILTQATQVPLLPLIWQLHIRQVLLAWEVLMPS